MKYHHVLISTRQSPIEEWMHKLDDLGEQGYQIIQQAVNNAGHIISFTMGKVIDDACAHEDKVRELEAEIARLKAQPKLVHDVQPQDFIARIALEQIWKHVGVKSQTACMMMLRNRDAAAQERWRDIEWCLKQLGTIEHMQDQDAINALRRKYGVEL